MLKKLVKMDLSSVRSLVEHYDNSDTAAKMTAKISSISSLNKLKTPSIKAGGGFIPDFSSRYFTADFPYGLAIIEEFMKILGAECDNIRKTMDWYCSVTKSTRVFSLKKYSIETVNDIYDFYGA